MTNQILQDFIFYDYSNIEIEYSVKTKIFNLTYLSDTLNIKPTRGLREEI